MTPLESWINIFQTYGSIVVYEVHKEYLRLLEEHPQEKVRYQQQFKELLEMVNQDFDR
jgi:hypothetical protein